MYGLSEFCVYLIKCIYRFLKYTGLIVPVTVVALIISVQEGYFGVTLSNLNLAVHLDFLLIYSSIILFLYILANHLIKTIHEVKLYAECINNCIHDYFHHSKTL